MAPLALIVSVLDMCLGGEGDADETSAHGRVPHRAGISSCVSTSRNR